MARNPAIVPRALSLARRLRQQFFPTGFDKILTIHGWTLECQLRYLMATVRSLSDCSRVVEIGVWQGRSALAMAEACRGTRKRVFAIDPWKDYNQGSIDVSSRFKEWGVTSFEDVYASFWRNCHKLDLEPWILPIRSTSLEAARIWSHGPVAMMFIDGNHDYAAVTADLDAWFPRVQLEGLICGDDWNWESVRAAVKDFTASRPRCHLQLPCENTWAFFKT